MSRWTTSALDLPVEDRRLRHAATMPKLHAQDKERPWCGGLYQTSQAVGLLLCIVSVVAIQVVRPVQSYREGNDMLCVLIICLCFWVFELMPIYATALLPAILMPYLKVTSADIAANAYWDWMQLLVVAVFLMQIALEQVRLPQRIAMRLLLRCGVVHPSVLLAGLMMVCWLLSMVISNTAVALMVCPFATGLVCAAEEAAERAAEAAGGEGGAKSGSGSSSEESSEEEADEVADVTRFGKGLLLGVAYSATIGGMATLNGSVTNLILTGQENIAGRVTWGKWFRFALPISTVTLVIAYVALWLRYVRKTSFRGLSHTVLEKEYEHIIQEVGEFSRDELVVGCLAILQGVLLIIAPWAIEPFFTNGFSYPLVNDAATALAPAMLLFLVPSDRRQGEAILTWIDVHENFDFGMLLLIGGSLAISKGFEESGLNMALSGPLADFASYGHRGDMNPICLQLVIMAFASLLTQVLSNISSASMVLPLLSAAATASVRNPMGMLPTATAASAFAFALPTATPPNVIVLAKSAEMQEELRVKDFLLTGLPICVAACLIGAFMAWHLGIFVFEADEPFPATVCANSHCMFLPIPGEVQMRQVWSQACILLDEYDSTLCQLWNRTLVNVSSIQAGSPFAPEPQPGASPYTVAPIPISEEQ